MCRAAAPRKSIRWWRCGESSSIGHEKTQKSSIQLAKDLRAPIGPRETRARTELLCFLWPFHCLEKSPFEWCALRRYGKTTPAPSSRMQGLVQQSLGGYALNPLARCKPGQFRCLRETAMLRYQVKEVQFVDIEGCRFEELMHERNESMALMNFTPKRESCRLRSNQHLYGYHPRTPAPKRCRPLLCRRELH
jgi:hypothetical protein